MKTIENFREPDASSLAIADRAPVYIRGNRILDALSEATMHDVRPALELIHYAAGTVTQEPGKRAEWTIFPIDAVLSVVTTLANGSSCEVGTLGNEGVSGIEGAFESPILRTTLCQIAGSAARMRTTTLVDLHSQHRSFAALMRATEKARMFFVEQLVVCNLFHTVERRCARWLLSMADRVSRDEYALTQEYLSFMLGVRRPAVTAASLHLQERGAITSRRGHIRIVDRPLLESLTCECYDLTVQVFDDAIRTWRPLTAHL